MVSEQNKKILIVDDDRFIRTLLKSILEQLDYDVIQAVDGEEGLRKNIVFSPDIIITDLYMPKKTGIELVKSVRLDLKSNVPILVISSSGVEEVVMLAFELGANDIIPKPFDLEDISGRIKKIINRKWGTQH